VTAIATTTVDVLSAIGVAVAASAAATTVLSVARARDLRRNRMLLADVSAAHTVVARAAADVEERDTKILRDVIKTAIGEVAADQELPERYLRGAIFARQPDGALRILKDQHVGEDWRDKDISIRLGESGVGEAFEKGRPVVTVFGSPHEESTIRDPAERALINTDLRWIIALRVSGGEDEPQWVLAVDGLVEARSQEQLHSSVARLLYYREILELLLRSRAQKT